jgi:hypothetical protein
MFEFRPAEYLLAALLGMLLAAVWLLFLVWYVGGGC